MPVEDQDEEEEEEEQEEDGGSEGEEDGGGADDGGDGDGDGECTCLKERGGEGGLKSSRCRGLVGSSAVHTRPAVGVLD